MVYTLVLTGCLTTTEHSTDLKFQFISAPASAISRTPFLTSGEKKNIILSWQESPDSITTLLRASKLNNDQWNTPVTVAKGSHWFVNWADFPVIQKGPGSMLLSHFLKKSGDGTYHYDIMLVLSVDNGQHWKSQILLNTDGKLAEHGFVSMTQAGSRGVQLAWLDGRNTTFDQGHHGAMSLRTALVTSTGDIREERSLDERVCDCCQTDLVTLPEGFLLVYRDRDEQEIRDIAGFRYQHGDWIALDLPQDGWQIHGCPVNGPQTAARSNFVAIAWFAAPEQKPKIQWTGSHDGGKNFTRALQIHQNQPLGRVDITILPDYSSVVTWMESEDTTSRIVASRIDSSGHTINHFQVADISAQRISGFPRIVSDDFKVYWTWTDANGPSIKTGYINFNSDL